MISYLDFELLKKERRKIYSFLGRAMENRGCETFTKFGEARW